jgi:hypothetical protein
MALFYRIYAYRKRFAQCRLNKRKLVGYYKTIFRRHNYIFAQAAVALAGRSEELYIPAGIFPAHFALVAFVTDDRRLNGNFVADFYIFHSFADLSNCRGTFVTDLIRIYYNL